MISPDLALVLALVSHGNAWLRGAPCPCDLLDERSAHAEGVSAWLESLEGARRLWVTSFAAEKRPAQWGVEVEREGGSEVWLAGEHGSGWDLEPLFWGAPAVAREVRMDEAARRLGEAFPDEAHRIASALEVDHLFPDRGYPRAARELFERGLIAHRVAKNTSNPSDELLQGAVLGALLTAVHAAP